MSTSTLRSHDGDADDDGGESGVFGRGPESAIPLATSLAAPRMPRFEVDQLPEFLAGGFEASEPQPALPLLATEAVLQVLARDVRESPLSAREGFVLALVDGETSVQDLIDVTPMGSTEVMQILSRLQSRRLIG